METVVIHTTYASNDITNDLGWDILVYVAIDHRNESLVAADISQADLKDHLAAAGYDVLLASEAFVYGRGGWGPANSDVERKLGWKERP